MMRIPKEAVMCAARHIFVAHRTVIEDCAMDWTFPCTGMSDILPECPYAMTCKGDWLETLEPIFDSGVWPKLS